MEFRKSTKLDINDIMKIIKQAQNYFKENKIDQWQNNYPNYDTIENDIDGEESYVLVKDGKIVATAALSFNGEGTYNNIYNGKWLSNNKYAVVHRVAVDENYKGQGLSSKIFENIEKICINKNINSIKIDTHKNNLSMQKLLEKEGFIYCGIIYLSDKSKRIAFEKIV